jgi:hypothetical protein
MSSDVLPDALETSPAPTPAFDRTYFNLHGSSRGDGFLVLGIGTYPATGTADAYVVAVPGGGESQRNLRMSTVLDPATGGRIGPISWKTIEPHREWTLRLESNPSGVELDVVWRARSAIFVIPDYRTADDGGASEYAHLFQSGFYDGSLTIDGKRTEIRGWHGQRDRSKGRRRTHDRLGMHLWVQAQLPDGCIGFLYNEDRQGRASHFNGANMRPDGSLDRIVSLRHDLRFNEAYELEGGHFELEFSSGDKRFLKVESTGRGILMQGAGYNGWHGVPRGHDHLEFEEWPLDGSRTPRNLEIGITDALCQFDCSGVAGSGITEYALTRSASYTYRPGGASLT